MSTAQQFYSAFKNKDIQKMWSIYADDITFTDPAFGTLNGEEAKYMWKMLLENEESQFQLNYTIISENNEETTVKWTAQYFFGPNRRTVINHVIAKLSFENGQIKTHTDHFSMWKWSKQALGISGFLLGWTPFFKQKVQKMTQSRLKIYIQKQNESK